MVPAPTTTVRPKLTRGLLLAAVVLPVSILAACAPTPPPPPEPMYAAPPPPAPAPVPAARG